MATHVVVWLGVAVILIAGFSQGCMQLLDPTYTMNPPGYSYREATTRPREPYGGTGTVVEVRITSQTQARADYSPNRLPMTGDRMLLVRTNSLVGYAQAIMGGRWLWVTEGAPEIGDLVIGIQNEREYKKATQNFR